MVIAGLMMWAIALHAADTYTSYYNYRKPDLNVEDQETPWGDKYNNNWDLADAADRANYVAIQSTAAAFTAYQSVVQASTASIYTQLQSTGSALTAETAARIAGDAALAVSTSSTYATLQSTAAAFTAYQSVVQASTASIYTQLQSTGSALTAETAARIAADLTLIPSTAAGNYALRAATATYLATAPGECGAGEFISALTADGTKTCAAPAGGGDMVLAATQTITGTHRFMHNPVTYINYFSGVPTSTPTAIGDHLISTQTYNIYEAVCTSGFPCWTFMKQGSPSAWTPSSPAGLTSWYDSNNGPSPATNGSAVTGWTDRSVTGNNMAPVSGTLRYDTNIQNGLPGVYFGGDVDLEGSNKADTSQPTTHFLAFKPTSWGTGVAQTVANMYASQTISKEASSTNLLVSAGTSMSLGPISNNTPCLVSVIFNGATSSGTVNGGVITFGNVGTTANSNYPLPGYQYFVGYIFEWLVYQGALSPADVATVKSYLNSKWALY